MQHSGRQLASGASPDEAALAEAAGAVDVALCSGRPGFKGTDILKVDDTISYEVLEVIEFKSDRKRMSMILQKKTHRGDASPEILEFTKGADNIMEPLLERKLAVVENQCLEDCWSGLLVRVFGCLPGTRRRLPSPSPAAAHCPPPIWISSTPPRRPSWRRHPWSASAATSSPGTGATSMLQICCTTPPRRGVCSRRCLRPRSEARERSDYSGTLTQGTERSAWPF
mmetsp:Transcript_29209/g.82216  ORF Transcript_29209/g.82216 Transcript_29209/m.82216 type:complete len:226 (-) Transcript_29209:90-767(-)